MTTLLLTASGWIAFAVVCIASWLKIKYAAGEIDQWRSRFNNMQNIATRSIKTCEELKELLVRVDYDRMAKGYREIERRMK